VIEGHALSHGRNIPFLPMLEVFRDYYGFTPQDDPRSVREKIAGRLLLLDESFREAPPIIYEGVAARAAIDSALAQAFAWLDESGGAPSCRSLVSERRRTRARPSAAPPVQRTSSPASFPSARQASRMRMNSGEPPP
jgi:hypothetical protein